jgi:cold shock CspA family protein
VLERAKEEIEMESGVVVHVNRNKGYAFVRWDKSGVDFFFHLREWKEDEIAPVVGMKVQFDFGRKLEDRPRPMAINVSLVQRTAATAEKASEGGAS